MRQGKSAVTVALACLVLAGLRASGGGQAKNVKPGDAYTDAYRGWEMRPLENARRQGRLVFESDFSESGLARDWIVDGVTVERSNGAAILSLSPGRISANKKYGVLWTKKPFTQPQMIEVQFALDPSAPHDANVFWGQKEPAADDLGKDQECFIMGCFGWGGHGCGLEGARCGTFGITATVAPRPGKTCTAVWIVDGRLQCLYLDGSLLIYSRSPEPPPSSGLLGLSVFQSKVSFQSVKAYALNRGS